MKIKKENIQYSFKEQRKNTNQSESDVDVLKIISLFIYLYIVTDVNQSGTIERKDFELAIEVS